MNEKQVILDFLKWYWLEPKASNHACDYGKDVNEYLSSKEPKEEDHQDWFLHTHWTENTNIA